MVSLSNEEVQQLNALLTLGVKHPNAPTEAIIIAADLLRKINSQQAAPVGIQEDAPSVTVSEAVKNDQPLPG
jgi:hypothetical protein